MVEGTDKDGKTVMVPKTTPEETVPSVRTQRGVTFSRAEQDRLTNANLATGSAPVGESVGASPQDGSATTFPPTTSGAPARGGATRTTPTRPRGQE